MADTEGPTYGALYDVPASLLDQACYARIAHADKRPDWVYVPERWWQIEVYSASDQLLCVATSFPTEEYARKHCGHARIEVR